MPEAQQQEEGWEQKKHKASDVLRASINKLKTRSEAHVRDKYGVSAEFADSVQSDAHALELCEQAMATLAEDYVDAVTRFKESATPLEKLAALEQAEVIWHGEAAVIRQLDTEGEESQFLGRVRAQTFVVMQDALEAAAEACSKKPTDETVALCLAVLGVMDSIQEELGAPMDSPERQQYRSIAKSFK